MTARFDVTQRLEYSDNPDLAENGDSELFGRTILGFGLASDTQTERFLLNLGTQIDEGRNDQSTFNLRNYNANLDYGRETRNANIGLSLGFRKSKNDSNFTNDDFDASSDVVGQDDGNRSTYTIGLNGAFGLNAPIGGSYQLDYSEIKFSGSSDADLTDRSSLNLSGQLNFRFDPRIVGRLTASYRDFDTQGEGVDRETTGFGAGVRLDVTPRLTADIGLSYDTIERSGDQTGEDDGISATVELSQAMPNGTIGISLSSNVASNDEGRRTFLRFTRDMDLSRTSSLSLSAGATRTSGSGIDPLIELRYDKERRASRFGLSLRQSVDSNTDNQERINSSLRADYSYVINNQSSISLDFSLFNRNELSGSANDAQRMDIGASYRHSLTKDWGLVSGYTFRRSTSDNRADRTSNTVFVGLQRSFSWNP